MCEFVVNFIVLFNDPSSEDYQHVHVYGVCFSISLGCDDLGSLGDPHPFTEELVT